MLYGQAIDTQQAMQKGTGREDRPLVPKEWQLVARHKDGSESCIAENVLSFDVSPEGQIIYSDGTTVYSLNASGEKTEMGKGDFIEKVAILN